MEEKNEGEMDVAMYIATSYDKQSQAWTKFSPTKLVSSFVSFSGNKISTS